MDASEGGSGGSASTLRSTLANLRGLVYPSMFVTSQAGLQKQNKLEEHGEASIMYGDLFKQGEDFADFALEYFGPDRHRAFLVHIAALPSPLCENCRWSNDDARKIERLFCAGETAEEDTREWRWIKQGDFLELTQLVAGDTGGDDYESVTERRVRKIVRQDVHVFRYPPTVNELFKELELSEESPHVVGLVPREVPEMVDRWQLPASKRPWAEMEDKVSTWAAGLSTFPHLGQSIAFETDGRPNPRVTRLILVDVGGYHPCKVELEDDFGKSAGSICISAPYIREGEDSSGAVQLQLPFSEATIDRQHLVRRVFRACIALDRFRALQMMSECVVRSDPLCSGGDDPSLEKWMVHMESAFDLTHSSIMAFRTVISSFPVVAFGYH